MAWWEQGTRSDKWVCIECKLMRSLIPHEEDGFLDRYQGPDLVCGECGKTMIRVDSNFRPPRRHKRVDWAAEIRPFRLDKPRRRW